MSLPDRSRLYHTKPHWVGHEASYFITICATPKGRNQLTRSPDTASHLLSSVAHYHDSQTWWVHSFLLMPDHAHALINVAPDKRLSASVSAWKAWQAKNHGIEWQSGFFDHRLRSADSFQEKASYIRMNPVRAGLAVKPDDWPYVWTPS